MAAATYTTDLVGAGATGDEASGWIELTGTATDPGTWGGNEAYSTQGAPAYQDPDYPYIQGSFSVTQDCTKDAGIGSLAAPTGGSTHGTDGAYFVWHNYMVASNIGTYAQGGLQVVVATDATNFSAWFTGGVDKAPYPYGGWVNHVANTTVTPDTGAGNLTTENYAGSAVYVTIGSSKGEVHNTDQVRWGRGSAIFELGELNGINGGTVDQPATFIGFSAQNDSNTNRWGLIQSAAGGYLWKGRMALGTAANPVVFKDANTSIFVDWTPKVTANFNLIEVINASSYINWSNLTFQCLDTTTASRGRMLVTDNATILIDSCSFTDMDTFIFQSNTNISSSTFRRCNSITPAGATMSTTLIANPLSTNPGIILSAATQADTLSSLTFDMASQTNKTAIEITAAGDYTFNGHQFINMGGSGTWGVDFSGTGTVNIIPSNGCNITQAMCTASGGGTIVVQSPQVDLVIRNLRANSEVRVFRQSDGVEVGVGTENATVPDTENPTTRFQHTITHAQGGTAVNIIVAALGYQNTFIPYTLKSTNDSILVSQVIDRTYTNP